MGLESRSCETPTATLAELQAFRSKAIELGLPSPATAELIRWEWLQREIDIFFTFEGTRLISLPGRRHHGRNRGSEFGCRYSVAECRAACIWDIR
jgi:hypothetical protein